MQILRGAKLALGAFLLIISQTLNLFSLFRGVDWLQTHAPQAVAMLGNSAFQASLVLGGFGMCAWGLWEIWTNKQKAAEISSVPMESTPISQTTHGPNSPNVVGDNSRVEYHLGQQRRSIKDPVKMRMRVEASGRQKILVRAWSHDGEVKALQSEVTGVLRQAKWEVETDSMLMFADNRFRQTGCAIAFQTLPCPPAQVLSDALTQDGGIEVKGMMIADTAPYVMILHIYDAL